MLNINSLSTKLLYSTTRIVAFHGSGGQSVGTAFFFLFRLDDKRTVPTLVTNKHVVLGSATGEFHLHEAIKNNSETPTPAGSSFAVTVTDFEKSWIMHPDPDVDLCAMPFEPLRRLAANHGKEVFLSPLDDTLIPLQSALDGLSAMEDVVMVGYPIGLWDSTNNFPILRRGTTASHPASDFQGKPMGVVDMACFPGSSGSPILIANEGGFATSQGFSVGTRVHLLGVLYALPQYTADGTIRVEQIPTHSVAMASTYIPIHLGYYVKSRELLTLKQHLMRVLGVI
jgi:hypothetical protein